MQVIGIEVMTIDLNGILDGLQGWKAIDQRRKSLVVELPASLIQAREIRLPRLEALHCVEEPDLKSDDYECAD